MKKYQCPNCKKLSSANEIDNHLLFKGYVSFTRGFSINDDNEDSKFEYHCPHCDVILIKKDFIQRDQ